MVGSRSSKSSLMKITSVVYPKGDTRIMDKGTKKNVLIIGAGGVAHVAAHKCAQNNDILGDICIASRKKAKCDKIIESVKRKGSLKVRSGKIYSRQVDAMDVPALSKLIKSTKSQIV